MDAAESRQAVEDMTDADVLTAFDTAADPTGRGFDDATQLRVLASELVRARNRVATYRALYASFLAEGKHYLIENVAEDAVVAGVPAKLVFTDDAARAQALEDHGDVVVWTEPDLLATLTQERVIQDFFTELLDELAARWP
jgi:hypothetical protein